MICTDIETKKCTKCGEIKSLSKFALNKPSYDGHISYCKDCKNNIWRDYNRNKMKDLHLVRPWLSHFRNAINRCSYPSHSSFKYYGAIGIKCLLKLEDVKYLWIRDKAYLMRKPSINRIDNDDNYTLENCEFIELSDNCKESLYRRWYK